MFGLVSVCLASMSLMLFSIAALLRLLPRLLNLIHRGLRGLLILSFRFYRLILSRIAPFVYQHLNGNLLAGPLRVVSCLVLSLVLGSLLFMLVSVRVTGLSLALFLFHGLAVGLAWDEIEEPGGLQLGVKLQ